MRNIGLLGLLLIIMLLAWFYGRFTDQREILPADTSKVAVADGDSFAIDKRRLRLDGIDAPEYLQTCADENGSAWECGKASRAALEQIMLEPGLTCTAEAQDRYSRSIATCSSKRLGDVAAEQVLAGMAVSDEFYGMRSYGTEEDQARGAKRGIWRGQFTKPSEWRAAHPTLRTKTVPAE
jgi:endonuclease YncB( thermonuclease family)